ncbi:MAG TPA: fimbria/pilus periplasmic chaperone [Thermoanaerobaculia bacterium]|nr:fimbria/pilus periplasmic chaperone [Thermoanaerobaculia bacterium]
MKRQRFLRVSFLVSSFFVGLAILRPDVSLAATFQITPVKVLLSRRVPTALLTLKNGSDRRLRFQATAFAWGQTPEGKMELVPTRDVVFFPPLLTVEPGTTRKVRLGAATEFGTLEKSYRIFFEELPELDPEGPAQSQLKIRTRMGIPIFLRPEEPEMGSRVELARVSAGLLSFSLRNTGNVHVNLRGVRVRGLGPAGEPIFDRESDGWYVLAGKSRDYAIEVPEDRCREVARLVIEAKVDDVTVLEKLEMSSASCR